MTEWGPALTGPECKQLRLPDDIRVCCEGAPGIASDWWYGLVTAEYTLPANHPAYKVAEYNRNHPEAPMVYHGGSDEAPKDWNGGEVLHALGGLTTVYDWALANEHKSVIGYVPTPVVESRPATDELKECVRLSRELFSEESDTVTLKRMTPGEFTIRYGLRDLTPIAVAVELGLIREETLLEQFERQNPHCIQSPEEREAARSAIEWMEKRQGDKS